MEVALEVAVVFRGVSADYGGAARCRSLPLFVRCRQRTRRSSDAVAGPAPALPAGFASATQPACGRRNAQRSTKLLSGLHSPTLIRFRGVEAPKARVTPHLAYRRVILLRMLRWHSESKRRGAHGEQLSHPFIHCDELIRDDLYFCTIVIESLAILKELGSVLVPGLQLIQLLYVQHFHYQKSELMMQLDDVVAQMTHCTVASFYLQNTVST